MGLTEDVDLAERVRNGDEAAVEELVGLFAKPLTDFLISKCGEGQSRDKATNIGTDVIAECTSQGLLQKYSGKGSLEGWIKRIGHFRLINYWNSAEVRKISNPSQWEDQDGSGADIESVGSLDSVAPDSEDGDAIADILRQAFVWGLADLRHNHPESLVLLRFHWLYGVEQKRLGEAWDRSAARVSRLISDGLERLGNSVKEFLGAVDPLLQIVWQDCLRFCSRYNLVLFDEEAGTGDDGEEEVAAG